MANRFSRSFKQGIEGLFPGYFALVMATGIVSIAAHLLNLLLVAQILLVLNMIAYGILWILYLARLAVFPKQVVMDLGDHARGPGFFTMVAGTCVLGSQFVLVAKDTLTAAILWFVGCVLWLTLIYTIFTLLIVKPEPPALDHGINGTWLVAVVATQSISVLGTLLAGSLGGWEDTVLFISLAMYTVGGMLYILLITLIFYRLFFFSINPEQLTAPYWINMGALAISTLAGDLLILNAGKWTFLGGILPFLKGLNILFWSTATWWIPLMVILGAWRHIYKRYPLRYEPQYWSLVFPLGMYTVSTFQLANALGIPALDIIPRYFIYLALAVWLITFIGMLVRIGQSLLIPRTNRQPPT